MKRVLQVISSSGFFGAEKVMLEISRAIRERDGYFVEVAVIGASGSMVETTQEAFRKEGFKPYLLNGRGKINLDGILQLRDLVCRGGFRLVHSHNYKSNVYSFAATVGVPEVSLVSTCHNWIDLNRKMRIYGILDRMVLKKFDAVVAVSETVRNRLLRAGIPDGRVSLIGNMLMPGAHSDAHRAIPPWPSDRGSLSLIFVGRLSHEKGVDVLLHALASLAGSGRRIVLRVIGDGPDRRSLESLARELGVGQMVEWFGYRTDVDACLRASDVFILPSRTEASPMTVLEAMAAGIPVIASDVGDISKNIRDAENGFLMEPGDHDRLASLIEILSKDKESCERMGAAGRKDYDKLCALSGFYDDYFTIYGKVGHA